MKRQIDPKVGSYFRQDNIIYLAKEPEDFGTCKGCCFSRPAGRFKVCDAPDNLRCSGRIYADVTSCIEVELVDEHEVSFGFWGAVALVVICLAFLIFKN